MSTLGRELLRKLVQVAVGFGLIALAGMVALSTLRGVLTGLLIGALAVDHIIIRHRVRIPVYAQLARPDERQGIHGPTWLLAGALAAAWLFPLDVALAAMALVFFGDAAAAVVGQLVPQPKLLRKKSLAGTGAMLVASLAATLILLPHPAMAAVMSVTGTLVELVGDRIDDNLAVPVLAGLAGHLLF